MRKHHHSNGGHFSSLKNTGKKAGYTLVEMALVIAVLGVIGGGMLTVMAGKQEAHRLSAQDRQLKAIDEAIIYYVKLRGHLPCPALPDLEESHANFGREDCSGGGTIDTVIDADPSANPNTDDVWVGMLPVRSLGLSDRYLYDEWNSRIGYAVIKALTDGSVFGTYGTNIDTGVIHITDAAGNQMTELDNKDVVAYLFLSYGKDRKGGYTRTGSPIACTAGYLDSTNCDHSGANDNTFIDAEVNDTHATGNDAVYFYDKVRWKSLAQLRAAVEMGNTCDPSIIVAGKTSSFAIDENGHYFAWGANTTAQFGNGTDGVPSTSPLQVTGHNWDAFHGEGYIRNMCAIDSGQLYCWGEQELGGLANGSTAAGTVTTPTLVAGFSDWQSVSADYNTGCGVRATGQGYCWGRNDGGQVGDNSQTSRSTPTEINGSFTDWELVVTGGYASCGIRSGVAYCWGKRTNGQIGDGNTVGNQLTPAPVGGGWTDWTIIAKRSTLTCGIANGGQAYCWGSRANGRVGDGSTIGDATTPSPVSGAYTDWTFIDAADVNACGIRSGHLWCWGDNTNGQIGDNTTNLSSVPVEVDGNHADWTSVSVNGYVTCGIRNNGKFYCWGKNNDGQLGDGTTTERHIPTEVTGINACIQ